jgi:hypothetical protein
MAKACRNYTFSDVTQTQPQHAQRQEASADGRHDSELKPETGCFAVSIFQVSSYGGTAVSNTTFPLHYPPIIVKFDATECQLLTVYLNKPQISIEFHALQYRQCTLKRT